MSQAALKIRQLVREERIRRDRLAMSGPGAVVATGVAILSHQAGPREMVPAAVGDCCVIPFPGRTS